MDKRPMGDGSLAIVAGMMVLMFLILVLACLGVFGKGPWQ